MNDTPILLHKPTQRALPVRCIDYVGSIPYAPSGLEELLISHLMAITTLITQQHFRLAVLHRGHLHVRLEEFWKIRDDGAFFGVWNVRLRLVTSGFSPPTRVLQRVREGTPESSSVVPQRYYHRSRLMFTPAPRPHRIVQPEPPLRDSA